MKEIKTKRIRKSLLLKIALFVFVLYLVVTLIGQQVQIGEKRSELADKKNQIVIQQLTNEEIRQALESEDGDYIESIARDEFDYVKPGERVFINVAGK